MFHIRFFPVFAAAILSGCLGKSRIVSVNDAQTGLPIEGAFIYVADCDMLNPFNTHGLYKSDSNGLTPINERGSVIYVLAGKEGYSLWRTNESVDKGDFLETRINLKKEKEKSAYKARTEYFKRFPSDAESQKIASEIKSYFAKRNTRIIFDEDYDKIADSKIRVVDSETKKPIKSAMLLITVWAPHFSTKELLVETDEDGTATVSLEQEYQFSFIKTGKEGYFPSNRFKKDEYRHNSYNVELAKTGLPTDTSLKLYVLNKKKFSKAPTDIPLWERYKTYIRSVGGDIFYSLDD